MNKLPKLAVLGLAISFMAIAIGCLFAINSCAMNGHDEPINNDNNTDDSTNNEGYYEKNNLDEVILPEGLSEQIKEYAGFTVSFNKDNHTPNYVAWELLGSEVSGDYDRSDYFWQDNDIIGCPAYKDYTNSGYDRGHMCPAADQKWSEQAMWDSFVMANMCPQIHDLNAGAWLTLENKERQWAKRDSAIYIIAGPIYEGNAQKRIGNIGVRVPDGFFKVFLAPYIQKPRAIAFVYPNQAAPGNMQSYAMSVDDLEEILGFDFFSALPDSIENKIESKFSFTEWNSSK